MSELRECVLDRLLIDRVRVLVNTRSRILKRAKTDPEFRRAAIAALATPTGGKSLLQNREIRGSHWSLEFEWESTGEDGLEYIFDGELTFHTSRDHNTTWFQNARARKLGDSFDVRGGDLSPVEKLVIASLLDIWARKREPKG